MIGSLCNMTTEIDLHVSGGFADARGESLTVSRTLFNAIAAIPRTMHLRTLCIHESNTLRLVSQHVFQSGLIRCLQAAF